MALTIRDAGHSPSLRASPSKRKRNDSTSISAADSIFAPDMSSSQIASSSSIPSSPPPLAPVAQPQPLEIRTVNDELGQEQSAYPSADSPRSAVAHKLEGLDLATRIKPMPILSFGDAKSKGGERKKPKLDLDAKEAPFSDSELDPSGVRAGSPTKPNSSRVKSPPLPPKPPKGNAEGKVDESNIIWWSDAEITGHLGLDPEDDGYGINGVGFRPTPAMAAARSMKRRRQVEDWRSRELREERRRRAEGRRRTASVDPGGTGAGSRHVRFA